MLSTRFPGNVNTGCRAVMIQRLLKELCIKLTCSNSLLFEMFILQLTTSKERVNFLDPSSHKGAFLNEEYSFSQLILLLGLLAPSIEMIIHVFLLPLVRN